MSVSIPERSELDIAGLEELAALFAGSARRGDRFYLRGELGTGKTTFARAYLRALGIAGSIPSPSFIMDAVYSTGDLEVHHLDLFRLECTPMELVLLGFEEVLETADIVLVEWADRLADLDSRPGVVLTLAMTGDPDSREVTVEDRRVAGD
jgi:tRNA threonylcarbamoyladenosine biosynthesis protein TsaE